MTAPETTEALVERVREWYGAEMTPPEALTTLADRVKELERERDAWRDEPLPDWKGKFRRCAEMRDEAFARAERAEAEVQRLREALEKISNLKGGNGTYDVDWSEDGWEPVFKIVARAALSEEPRHV